MDIGEHEGGDLVLYEPGLVIPLRDRDMLIFFLNKLTHFNMPFKGNRASLVLHSDAGRKKWIENRNDWKDNQYLH